MTSVGLLDDPWQPLKNDRFKAQRSMTIQMFASERIFDFFMKNEVVMSKLFFWSGSCCGFLGSRRILAFRGSVV